MSAVSRNNIQFLNTVLLQLVSQVNGSDLKTIYTYTGVKDTHEPVYYEETGLFKQMIEITGIALEVIEVSDSEFTPSRWDPKTSVAHIPGAMSTALDKHLGQKILELKEFTERGGHVLAWCGGGYWASHRVIYKSGSETLDKTRALSLWKGTEYGPLLPYHGNPEGTIGWFHGAVNVKWLGSTILQKTFGGCLELNVLLSGGGYFVPAKDEHEHEVLAEYAEHQSTPRASVKTYVGDGVAILINPYLTHGAGYLRPGLEGYKKYFPDHQWDTIMSKLDNKETELKSRICFVDIFAAFTESRKKQ